MQNILCTKGVAIMKEIIHCHVNKSRVNHLYNIVCERYGKLKNNNIINFIH